LTTELDYENQNANASAAAEITDEMLEQSQEVQDPTRDINVPLEPPRAGVYKWRWKPNVAKKGGLYFKATDNNQLLLNVSLLGQLLAEGTPLEGSDFDGFHGCRPSKFLPAKRHHFNSSLRKLLWFIPSEIFHSKVSERNDRGTSSARTFFLRDD
jgi:hypothetical protein